MSEINMTPLIDVMLVLVVIFIITAPLLVSAVKVDLPNTPGAMALSAPRFLSLTIDRSGKVYLDDRLLGLTELGAALRIAARLQPDTEVRLRADAAVAYGRVVEVMGLTHQAGLHRIGFVAERVPAGK
jgi:biopolymer transport protein TolR